MESIPQGRWPHFILTVQLQDLPFCRFLRGFGGILADEMGLGKTVQTAAFLACLKFTNQGRDGACASNGVGFLGS